MKKGFTLIEILVVLVVIGILIAAILPNALRAIDQANARSTASNLRNMDAAIQLCYNNQPANATNAWAACDSLDALDGNGGGNAYMESIPANDPWNNPYDITTPKDGSIGLISDKTGHFPNWPDISTHNNG